jgi:hypothetical protein
LKKSSGDMSAGNDLYIRCAFCACYR